MEGIVAGFRTEATGRLRDDPVCWDCSSLVDEIGLVLAFWKGSASVMRLMEMFLDGVDGVTGGATCLSRRLPSSLSFSLNISCFGARKPGRFFRNQRDSFLDMVI